jgi:hypothetical protein
VKRILLSLHDQTVEVHCPPSVAPDLEFLYRDNLVGVSPPASRIAIEGAPDGTFSIAADGDAPVSELTRGGLPTFVMEAVVRGLVGPATSTALPLWATAPAWRATAVARGDAAPACVSYSP